MESEEEEEEEGEKDVNAQYMILGFSSHSRLLEHLGLARKQWWWLVVVADSEHAQLYRLSRSFALISLAEFLETYLTSTTSESSVFTPCFFGSYSAIIARIGVLCNRIGEGWIRSERITLGANWLSRRVASSRARWYRGLIKWGRVANETCVRSNALGRRWRWRWPVPRNCLFWRGADWDRSVLQLTLILLRGLASLDVHDALDVYKHFAEWLSGFYHLSELSTWRNSGELNESANNSWLARHSRVMSRGN